MKLNDFVKKPRNTKPIKPQTQFVLQNDAAIRKYQDQINELDIQLGYYRTIEAERDNAVSKLTLEKEKTTEAQDEVNRLNTAVTDLIEGQRYYDIHPPGFTGKVLTINDVQVDDIKIPRFIGNPEVDDTTDES